MLEHKIARIPSVTGDGSGVLKIGQGNKKIMLTMQDHGETQLFGDSAADAARYLL